MKDELRSESQAEMGGAGLPAVLSVVAAAAKSEAFSPAMAATATAEAAEVGKSGKTHFSARLIFLPSPSMSVHESPCQSKSIKVDQTCLVGQAGGRNPCKSLIMNSLQNKQS